MFLDKNIPFEKVIAKLKEWNYAESDTKQKS